jgi:hypothetical protein
MEITLLTPPGQDRYDDVPLGAEASVLHLDFSERNDHENRAEPRQAVSLDAWRG